MLGRQVETLKPLTVDAAPRRSKAILQAIQNRLGFIPTRAHSPILLSSHVAVEATRFF